MAALAAVVLLLGLSTALAGAGVTSQDYRRPPASPFLPIDHERLARDVGAGPHVPEQVHLTLAGPGAMAVSWLTYPQDDPDLAQLVQQRMAAAVALENDSEDDDEEDDYDGGTSEDADEQREGNEELEEVASSMSADEDEEMTALEENGDLGRHHHHKKHHHHHHHHKKKKHHKKHRRDEHACEAFLGLSRSEVRFGTVSGEYLHAAGGNNTCYQADDYVSGALHHVVIGAGPEGPLKPNTTYFYTCGNPELGMSPEFSFTTPPLTGSSSLPYRLGLIGDIGQTENSAETLDHLTANNPESVINVGDLSYADGYQPRWDTWGRLIAPHTSRFPWAVIEGNHEMEVANGKTGFLAYETRFWFPSEQCRSHSPFYYSYKVAAAHVIMLGCYVEYGTDSEQYAWLEQDLASVDRSRTPWLIVGMHAPWYNSNKAHQHEVDDMLEAMEPLLFQYGTDVVFAGHVHAYERMYRTYRGKRDDCGPVYINIGDGGNREGLAETYDDPQPDYSAFREASYGHGIFELRNGTHALWQWHRNQDAIPVVSDEVWLVRDTTCMNRAPLQQQAADLALSLPRKLGPQPAMATS